MKIYETVSSQEKAATLIEDYVIKNNLNGGKPINEGAFMAYSNVECRCGETDCLVWHNNTYSVTVAFCEHCGNDSRVINLEYNLL